MKNPIADISQHKAAKVAGVLYLLVTLLSFVGIYVNSSIIVPGDAATTANNIVSNNLLFNLGFISDLMVQTGHIFLALALYKLLKPVNKNHASLMVILALVGIPIAMLNMLNQIVVTHLLSGAEYLKVFDASQLHALVLLFINFHKSGVFIAQIFWGLWLLPLGYLVYKSGYFPRIIGVLLMLGCFGYLIDFFIFFFIPKYEGIMRIFGLSELIFTAWLLLKGVKIQQSDDQTP